MTFRDKVQEVEVLPPVPLVLEAARLLAQEARDEGAVNPGEPDVRPMHEKLHSRALIPANTVFLALTNLLGDHPLTRQADEVRQALARHIETIRPKVKPKK